jgi:hypothetical protein
LSRVGKGIWVCVDNLALNLVGPTTIVSQAASNHRNINLCHTDRLPVVERLNSSQKIEVLLNQIGEVDEELASLLWRLLLPCSLECLAGSSYRDINVLFCGLVNGADNFFGSGVDRLEGLSVDALNPFVVDEPDE